MEEKTFDKSLPLQDETSSNVNKQETSSIFSMAHKEFAAAGPGNGKYNPDSPNYVEPKPGILKNKKGDPIKDSNDNVIRTRYA